jgi:plastocyanin
MAISAFAAATAAANKDVEIVDRAYQPAMLTVDVGETVTWSNTTLMPHTVTAVEGAFDSGTMNGQTSFAFTFSKTGTFLYSCTIHPSMKGTVVVRNAPAAVVAVSLLKQTAHSQAKLIRVQAPLPRARVLLEGRAGSRWGTIATTKLNGRGEATLTYHASGMSRRIRVVVLPPHGEEPLISRTLVIS